MATKEDKREKSTTTSNKCYLSLTSNHNNMKFRINKFIIKNEKLSNARPKMSSFSMASRARGWFPFRGENFLNKSSVAEKLIVQAAASIKFAEKKAIDVVTKHNDMHIVDEITRNFPSRFSF